MEGVGWGCEEEKGVLGEGFGAQKRVFRESNVMLLATTKVLLVIHAPNPLNPTTSNPSPVNYKSHRKLPLFSASNPFFPPFLRVH